MRKATRRPVAVALALALGLAGCGQGLDSKGGDGGSGGAGKPSVTVGSANFPENALLAEIYAGALRAKGVDVSTKLNVGSRETYFPAVEKGEIDVVPEYTGALLDYLLKGKGEATDTAGQVTELKGGLPAALTVLKPSAAQDQETITCTKPVVDRYGLTSIGDLAKVSRDLTLGGPPELAQRKGFGLEGLKTVYGVVFKQFRPLDVSGPLTVSALKSGKVQCANLFSTQSAIAVNGFVSLADPKGLIASQAVVPLIDKTAATPEVVEALDAVSVKLTTENLKQMVKRVEVDKDDAEAVAEGFLKKQGLG